MIIGILQRATDAKTNTERTSIIEQARLDIFASITDKEGTDLGEDEISAILGTYFNDVPEDLSDLTQKMTSKKSQYAVELSEVLNGVNIATVKDITIVKDKNGIIIDSTEETTPWLPTADTEITNNDLDTCLTIEDGNNNEWVWIIVPKDITKTATNDNDIYTLLRNYCTTAKDGNTLFSSSVGYADEFIDGKGLDESKYNEYKSKMLQSIKTNGGFWIGKYEAGTETSRGASADELTPAKIKQNLYPYNFITCSQAEHLAESLKTGGKTSTLMFGIQWDLTIKYLNECGASIMELTQYSGGWGNYYNQPFTIDRGKYSTDWPMNEYIPYTTSTANKVTFADGISTKIGTTNSNKILLTTGASDSHSKFNVYDLAGNVNEWTLSKVARGDSINVYVYRGGSFVDAGMEIPAAGYITTYDASEPYIGFRPTLY